MRRRNTPVYVQVLPILIAGVLFWLLDSWWHWLLVGVLFGSYIAYDDYRPSRTKYYKSTLSPHHKLTLGDCGNIIVGIVTVALVSGVVLWVIDLLLTKIFRLFF